MSRATLRFSSLAEQCHTQKFYLRCFNSDFDAVKSKFGLLIKKIEKTTSKWRWPQKWRCTKKWRWPRKSRPLTWKSWPQTQKYRPDSKIETADSKMRMTIKMKMTSKVKTTSKMKTTTKMKTTWHKDDIIFCLYSPSLGDTLISAAIKEQRNSGLKKRKAKPKFPFQFWLW